MTREPSDGEAMAADDDDGEVVAVTGSGVKRRKLNPDCPICVGGTGMACSWHFL